MGDEVIIPKRNREGRIIETIIQIKVKKEIIDTHIYLDNKRFQIRKKKGRQVMSKKFLQFGHKKNIAEEKNTRSLQRWGGL